MTTRNRLMTPRKRRGWTCTEISFAINAGGTGGTVLASVGPDFRGKFDRDFIRGDTLGHTWLKGVWTQSAAGDQSRDSLYLGIAFFTSATDANDLPDLREHDGNLQLHDARGFREPTTLQTPMVPIQLATVDIESAGQRSVPSGGQAYDLVCFGMSNTAPSAGSFEFQGVLTCLWLLG